MSGTLNVRKGDKVIVISGKDRDRDHVGRVIQVYPDRDKVLVEGVNRITKHTKITSTQRGSQSGGIVHQEAPIHVSNVQVVCPSCGKPSRIGHRRSEPDANGKTHSVRVCKRCNGDI